MPFIFVVVVVVVVFCDSKNPNHVKIVSKRRAMGVKQAFS